MNTTDCVIDTSFTLVGRFVLGRKPVEGSPEQLLLLVLAINRLDLSFLGPVVELLGGQTPALTTHHLSRVISTCILRHGILLALRDDMLTYAASVLDALR
jgi:hypothetical protein